MHNFLRRQVRTDDHVLQRLRPANNVDVDADQWEARNDGSVFCWTLRPQPAVLRQRRLPWWFSAHPSHQRGDECSAGTVEEHLLAYPDLRYVLCTFWRFPTFLVYVCVVHLYLSTHAHDTITPWFIFIKLLLHVYPVNLILSKLYWCIVWAVETAKLYVYTSLERWRHALQIHTKFDVMQCPKSE